MFKLVFLKLLCPRLQIENSVFSDLLFYVYNYSILPQILVIMVDGDTAKEAVVDEINKEEKKEEVKNEEKEAKKEEKKMKAIQYSSYGGGANNLKVIHMIHILILRIFVRIQYDPGKTSS